MDLKKQIRVALGLDTEDEIQLGFQAKTEDGTIIVSTADELAEGGDVSVLTEDGTTIKLPAGTYKLEDGTSFVVEEEGVVKEIMVAEVEAEEEEEKEELAEEKEEEEKEMADYDFKKIEERMAKLEEEVEKMKKDYGKGKEEEMSEETTEEVVEERSDSPKTVTTKTTEVVEFNAEEEIEKLRAENEKLKTKLSETPADNPINTNKFSSDKTELTRKEYNRLSKQERFLYNLNK